MNAFVKYYGTRDSQDAANVVFQMSEVYEKQSKTDELVKHLSAYLKEMGCQGRRGQADTRPFKLGRDLVEAFLSAGRCQRVPASKSTA